jgi:hypothetical protein
LKYLKIYEEFKVGKFSIEDIENAMIGGKGLYASIIKDLPDNDPKLLLKIIDVDKDTGEVSVLYDNQIKYLDLEDVEEIER